MPSQAQLLRLVQLSATRRTLCNANVFRRVSTSSTRNVAKSSVYKQQEQQQQQQDTQQTTTETQQEQYFERSDARSISGLERLALGQSLQTIKRQSHRLVELDPLGFAKVESLDKIISQESHSLINELRQRNDLVETSGLLASSGKQTMPINALIDAIFTCYIDQQCGLEFGHLSNQAEIDWLTSEWELLNANFHLTREQEIDLAKLLLKCEQFDHFMGAKFPTTKRYGCEGGESMLIVFDELLRLAQKVPSDRNAPKSLPSKTISDVLIAMPHRGRLNLLACLLGLDPAIIFNKCLGEPELDLGEAWMACGDVLSHLSLNARYAYGVDRHHLGLYRESPEPLNLSLLPNPSHLEVGAPMLMGAARGRAHNLRYGYSSSPKFNLQPPKQQADDCNNNTDRFTIEAGYSNHLGAVLPIQVHGDASLAGQGIIQETLQMSNLQQFTVNGSIHLVLNNQIGYTTPSSMGRSSRYCTDVFKSTEVPVIHINGENISSVLKATRLAFQYRQKFGKDVAIDLICFRRHGHNEMDEPSFTQPVMYENIRNRKSIPETYCDSIKLEPEMKKQIVGNYKTILQEIYNKRNEHKPNNDDYRNFALPTEYHRDHLINWQTGCDENLLRQVGLASVKYPDTDNDSSIEVHPTLKRTIVADRRAKFDKQPNPIVDWATAEMLAIGSLLRQNHSVRIAGQDVARGTFSTRHAVLFDQRTERPYVPLNWMTSSAQSDRVSSTNERTTGLDAAELSVYEIPANVTQDAKLEVANTILSEEAALAYEFGYSIETCELTIWEAQFGDFFNTAQSIVDTLLSSGEAKWLRQSALTLLLPHGLDGAGPEHSSSRLERFLQLSKSQPNSIDTDASVNWSVCFPTLPSQYFHLLRRQVLRPFRKPLVVMSPKIIFRHPDCASPLSDFGLDKTFEPVLDDPTLRSQDQRNNIDTMVLCSGKVYFQLNELRKSDSSMSNVALVRLEELCPFPAHALNKILNQYPNVHKPNQVTSAANNRQHRLVWFQEEHQNQGAYQFVRERLGNLLNISGLEYIGRGVSEMPAAGSSSLHKRELAQLLDQFKSLAKTTHNK